MPAVAECAERQLFLVFRRLTNEYKIVKLDAVMNLCLLLLNVLKGSYYSFSDDYDDDDDTTEDTGRSSPPALPPKRSGIGNRGRFYQPYSSDSVSAR